MKQGYLCEYFEAVAVKRLRAVEINPKRSNQHELNGTHELQKVLGRPQGSEQLQFPTTFIWLGEERESRSAEGMVTYYDSRFNQTHRSAEYRLYYPTTVMSELAIEGDSMFVARRPNGSLMMIVASAGSTAEGQLRWLFDLLDEKVERFYGHDIAETAELDFASRVVLDELGIDVEEPEAELLDRLIAPFSGEMPKVAILSAHARSTLSNVSAKDDPDAALIAWYERDEKLFKRLERLRIEERLGKGFGEEGSTDVEGFLKFSLSVQNSRKSRAGHAFENHISAVLDAHGVKYVRGARTENRAKPDFLFPGIKEYNDPDFPLKRLAMLGAKTTCKDRWRQVLSEAKRLSHKHLLTVEPRISENQTDEMRESNLQLVVPTPIHHTYTIAQAGWLMSVREFLDATIERQR